VYVHVVKEDPMRRGLLVAGTERGAFISLDDGDAWQPLQLNLPVTSVRDFEFHGTDLVVGTHGRGIWVIDDLSALRQLTAAVLSKDVHLFKPADAIVYVQGNDNGTPLQKDEPQVPNAPNGAFIDYYLRSPATTAVTLEIVDSRGAVLQTFSSDPKAQAAPAAGASATSRIPRVSPIWQDAPAPFSAAAGLHRAVWTPLPARHGAAPDGVFDEPPEGITGTFTARLTANGKTLTEKFTVKPDPRRHA
jgi:hypothetical protein